MREIKFRAWDKEDLQFKYTSKFGFDQLGMWILSDLYEVMQFTGLKDKNGKEIYEGDIVEYKSMRRALELVWTENYIPGSNEIRVETLREVVNYNDYGFTPFLRIWQGERIKVPILGMEVIGNIYETPNLLDKFNR